MDKYEASVWETTDATLIAKIQDGTVTLAELLVGATQRGATTDDYVCADSGAGCINIYAVSIPGVIPSRYLTWFQAAAAARNSGKRLPTNAEWQTAALGTPDPGATDTPTGCNINGVSPVLTGSRIGCYSDAGAFDMAGNLSEWVAEWVPRSTKCLVGKGYFWEENGDQHCLVGNSDTDTAGAIIRGLNFTQTTNTGVYAIDGQNPPTIEPDGVGFRAAR